MKKKNRRDLFGTEADDVRQLVDDQIDTLQAGLLETGNLFLNDGFESQIGGEETDADTVDVADGEGNLAAQLLLIKFHLDNLEGEALVEEAVDLGTTRQFHRVDISRSGAFDGPFEIRLQLLNHSI